MEKEPGWKFVLWLNKLKDYVKNVEAFEHWDLNILTDCIKETKYCTKTLHVSNASI